MALAREGATVVVSGRNKEAGDTVVQAIRSAGGTAHFVRADLAEGGRAATHLAHAAAETAGGPVNVLVNNAALLIPAQSLTEVDDQLADLALAVNIKAPAPGRRARPGHGRNRWRRGGQRRIDQRRHRHVRRGALWGDQGGTPFTDGVVGRGTGPKGHPGQCSGTWTHDDEENAAFHDMLRDYAAASPDGRPGMSAEVADAVVFLASDEAAHIHGVILPSRWWIPRGPIGRGRLERSWGA